LSVAIPRHVRVRGKLLDRPKRDKRNSRSKMILHHGLLKNDGLPLRGSRVG